MLESIGLFRHNVMSNSIKVPHSRSTNFYEGHDDIDEPPSKRAKGHGFDSEAAQDEAFDYERPHIIKTEADDGTEQSEESPQRKTDLETAAPPIKTDKQAIADYEATRAAQDTNDSSASARLNTRSWTRGKSSIYVDAFNLALETVLDDESHLFSRNESAIFRRWQSLAYEAQYLYVRLFLRKAFVWHRASRLGYHGDIADLNVAIRDLQISYELCSDTDSSDRTADEADDLQGSTFVFADNSADHITTLEEASSLLLLDELKSIAQDAKVQGKNKSELLKALRRTSGKQTGLGFSSLKRSETEESIKSLDDEDSRASTPQNRDDYFVQKMLAETGPCIRLSANVRRLFERVHLVFYRSTEWTEKSLTTIILARIARWHFPEYLVSRSANVFASRALLLEFEESIRMQFRVDNTLELGTPSKDDLQGILGMFDEILPRWRTLLQQEQTKEDSIYATGEGAYLRRLSPAWVYTRIIHKAAYVLGKFRHHMREHETLVELLNQDLFHTSRRGDWYQRKALLEEHYMHALQPIPGLTEDAQKKHYKRVALQTCEMGLEDRLVHIIYHHDLQKRVMKLEKSLKVPKRQQHDFGHVRFAKAVERTFEGIQLVRAKKSSTPTENVAKPIPSFNRSNSKPAPIRRSTKTIWIDPATQQPDGTGEQCSVEAMCLSNYRALGYKGYHSEGGILKTLFAYLFYDVLFLYIPNVFQTEYQTCPLDLHSDAFYPSRLSEINSRLNEISNGQAARIVQTIYDAHHEKKTCVVGLDWNFELADLLSICDCFPGSALATICKVLAQEYGQRGGGIPDLFLWREAGEGEQNGEVMFAEVKSENDRLSDTQRLWIDIISGAGVRVEKCNAVASEIRSID